MNTCEESPTVRRFLKNKNQNLETPDMSSAKPHLSSRALVYSSYLLIFWSLVLLAVTIYIAGRVSIEYSLGFWIAGGVSITTGICALFAGQDPKSRRRWVIVVSIAALISAVLGIFAAPYTEIALESQKRDCHSSGCLYNDTWLPLESSEQHPGGIECEWVCYESYQITWKAVTGLNISCIILNLFLVFFSCHLCCGVRWWLPRCCYKKRDADSYLSTMSHGNVSQDRGSEVPYERMEQTA